MLIACVSLLSIRLAGSLALQRPKLELAGDYNSYRCQLNGSGEGNGFQVLTLTGTGALDLAGRLCNSEVIAAHATYVEVHWYSRSFLTAQYLVEQQFDLIWNREHVAFGLVPDLMSYYERILESPHYQLFFVSRKSAPELEADWFEDKSLGLLSDSHSQSFFLQPLGVASTAGFHLTEEQKIYYPDLTALINAFRLGEVDVISAPEGMVQMLGVSPIHKTAIADDAPSGSWFLSRNRAPSQ